MKIKSFRSISIFLILTFLILLTQIQVAQADTLYGSVTIDLSSVNLNTSTNLIFGGVFFPNREQAADVAPKLADMGLRFVRIPIRMWGLLPTNISLNDYKNNVNNVQDPSTWDWNWQYPISIAKQNGMKVLGDIGSIPLWLSENNQHYGPPKDWGVYKDIIKKITEHFRGQLDYVALINEPVWQDNITGSSYEDLPMDLAHQKMKLAVDLQENGIKAIRNMSPADNVPILVANELMWPSIDGSVMYNSLGSILDDANLSNSEINMVGLHDYGNDYVLGPEVKNFITQHNRPAMPIIMTEWNDGGGVQTHGEGAIPYVGQKFIQLLSNGWTGANYFPITPYNYYCDDIETPDICWGDPQYGEAGIYTIGGSDPANGTSGTLAVQSRAWRVLSTWLKLGDEGTFSLKNISGYLPESSIVMGGYNQHNWPYAYISNTSSDTIETDITFNNGSFTTNSTPYAVFGSMDYGGTDGLIMSKWLTGSTTLMTHVKIPPKSVVGVLVDPSAPSSMYACRSGGNIATANAEPNPGESAANAIDGKISTKWCPGLGETGWLMVDLRQPYNLNWYGVKHAGAGGENWGTQSLNTRDFKIQATNNPNGTWTDLDTVTGNTADITSRPITGNGYRYVRIYITNPQTETQYRACRIYDFDVFGFPSGTNLTQGKTTTASAQPDSNEVSNYAVDCFTNTKWCSGLASSGWLKVDLGQAYNISRYVVKHAGVNGDDPGYNTRNFQFQVSNNGTSWTTIDTVTDNTSNITDHNVTANGYRYVRLNITNPQTKAESVACRIQEFEVFSN